MGNRKVKVDSSDVSGDFHSGKILDGGNNAFPVVTVGGIRYLKIGTPAPPPGGTERFLCPEMFDINGYGLAVGNGRTLSFYGYTLATALADYPFAAAVLVDSTALGYTLDFICSYCAISAMTTLAYQVQVHWGLNSIGSEKHYIFNGTFNNLPELTNEENWYTFDGHGAQLEWQRLDPYTNINDGFYSIPADKTESDSWILRHFVFKDMTINNPNFIQGDGSSCFKIGTTTNSSFSNVIVNDFDFQFNCFFMQGTTFANCGAIVSGNTGFRIASGVGVWTDATYANSGSNNCTFLQCVSYGRYNMNYGFHIEDSSDFLLLNNVIQGPTAAPTGGNTYASIGIFVDVKVGNTVVFGGTIDTTHVEWAYSTAAIKFKTRQGMCVVRGTYNQVQGLDAVINRVLFSVEHLSGVCCFKTSDNFYATANQQFEVDNANWCTFISIDGGIPGNPATAAAWNALTAVWAGGLAPITGNLRLTPAMF